MLHFNNEVTIIKLIMVDIYQLLSICLFVGGYLYKAYASTKEERLATFMSWPAGDKLPPEELVEAGFYYTGE